MNEWTRIALGVVATWALALSGTRVAADEAPQAAEETCTVVYSEGVPNALRNMVARYGEFRGLNGLLTNKPSKAWKELQDTCKLTTTLETEKGVALATAQSSCAGAAATPVCQTGAGATMDVEFKKPGKFRLKITSGTDAKLIFDLPFQIVQWDKTTFVSRSDWDKLGALIVAPDGLQFELVVAAASQADADKQEKAIKAVDFTLQVAVKHGKKVVGTGKVKTSFRDKSGELLTTKLVTEVEGVEVPLKLEHLATNGDWAIEVSMGKKIFKKYPFKVKDGAIVVHARQAPGYAIAGRALSSAPTGKEANYQPPAPRFWVEAK